MILRVVICRGCGAMRSEIDGIAACTDCSIVQVDGASVYKFRPAAINFIEFMVMTAGRAVHVDEIIGHMWPDPDCEPDQPENLIKNYASTAQTTIPELAICGQYNRTYRCGREGSGVRVHGMKKAA